MKREDVIDMARRMGGERAASAAEAGAKMNDEFSAKLATLITDELTKMDASEDGIMVMTQFAGIMDAVTGMLAKLVVTLHGSMNGGIPREKLMKQTEQAVERNLTRAFDAVEAHRGGDMLRAEVIH